MFSPTAAVLVHNLTGADLDTAVLEILQPEDCLLIHQITVTPEVVDRQWTSTAGRTLLRVYMPLSLEWRVTASMIKRDGLADYHPGRSLAARALTWANGATIPFQFAESADSVYVYETPSLTLQAGDLPAITFGIRLLFPESPDLVTYPATGPEGGSGGSSSTDPTGYVTLPDQDTAAATSTAVHQALEDAFTGTTTLEDGDWDITLYDGDPAGAGTALRAAVIMDPWTTYTAGPLATDGNAFNDAFNITETNTVEDECTHVRIRRGATLPVLDLELATPLTIPAGYGVTIPAGALSISLAYPYEGSVAPTDDTQPNITLLLYLCGGNRATYLPGDTCTVTVYTDDPDATGTELATWTEDATAAVWDVVNDTVAPVSFIAGPDPSVGGYTIGWVRVTHTATGLYLVNQALIAPKVVADAEVPSLDSTDFVMDLTP